MLSPKLKWNDKSLKKKVNSQSSLKCQTQPIEKHQKFNGKISNVSQEKQFPAMENLQKHLRQLSYSSLSPKKLIKQPKLEDHSLSQFKIIKRKVHNNNKQYSKIKSLLQQAKVILHYTHTIFNEIKSIFSEFKYLISHSFVKLKNETYKSNMVSNVNIVKKLNEIQKEIKQPKQKMRFEQLRQKLTHNQHVNITNQISSQSIELKSDYKLKTEIQNKNYPLTLGRSNMIERTSSSKKLGFSRERDSSIDKFKQALNQIKTLYKEEKKTTL